MTARIAPNTALHLWWTDDDKRTTRLALGRVVPYRGKLVYLRTHQGGDHDTPTNCPSPLDIALVAALRAAGIDDIWVYDARRTTLWHIAAGKLDPYGVRAANGRYCVYPPARRWRRFEGVGAHRQGTMTIFRQGDTELLLATRPTRDLDLNRDPRSHRTRR